MIAADRDMSCPRLMISAGGLAAANLFELSVLDELLQLAEVEEVEDGRGRLGVV